MSPRSIRLFSHARRDAWEDDLRLATTAEWNGQVFHGRLTSPQGLSRAAIEELLPPRRMSRAERKAIRDAEMADRVAAINAVVRAREKRARGNH